MKTTFAIFIAAIFLFSSIVSAHCDTLDGPVVTAAKKSLETKNPDHFLIWVQEKDESRILSEFRAALVSREKNPNASTETDKAFFESLVRIHREGEWAEYVGLKAEKQDETITLADSSINSGSWSALRAHVAELVEKRFDERFEELMKKKAGLGKSVPAGREYVESYVSFLHWIEGLASQASHANESSHSEPSDPHGTEVHGWDIGHAKDLPIAASGMFAGMLFTLLGTKLMRRKSR